MCIAEKICNSLDPLAWEIRTSGIGRAAPLKLITVKFLPKHRLFSTLLEEAHAAARRSVAAMTPARRGKISHSQHYHQTHFYAWLRGDDQAMSCDSLDHMMDKAGLVFRYYGNSLTGTMGY